MFLSQLLLLVAPTPCASSSHQPTPFSPEALCYVALPNLSEQERETRHYFDMFAELLGAFGCLFASFGILFEPRDDLTQVFVLYVVAGLQRLQYIVRSVDDAHLCS